MAQVTEGSARMLNNDALDDDEVAEGWVRDLPGPADQSHGAGGLRVSGERVDERGWLW